MSERLGYAYQLADNGLLPVSVAADVLSAVQEQSAVLALATRRPMPAGVEYLPLAANQPKAEWIDTGERKPYSEIVWTCHRGAGRSPEDHSRGRDHGRAVASMCVQSASRPSERARFQLDLCSNRLETRHVPGGYVRRQPMPAESGPEDVWARIGPGVGERPRLTWRQQSGVHNADPALAAASRRK